MVNEYNCAFCGKKCASEFAGQYLCDECKDNIPAYEIEDSNV